MNAGSPKAAHAAHGSSARIGASRHRRAAALALLIGVAGLAGACREQLDGGPACSVASALCPGQAVDLRDTIIDPVLAFDSTFGGFPGTGTEVFLPLVNYGDSLETVAIARFDTLTTLFSPPGDTVQSVLYADSVYLRMDVDLRRARVPDSVRIDVYDVGDPTLAPGFVDSVPAMLRTRFVPGRIIGGKTFSKVQIVDSILVPVNDSAMLAHLRDSTYGWPRLRVGVRVRGIGGPVAFRIGSEESGSPMRLRYRPKADTSVHQQEVNLASGDPADRADIRIDLRDFPVVLKSKLPNPPNQMMIGGIPGNRVYLRFNIPSRLSDSTTVIRATLRLTQVPYPFGADSDTVVVHTHVVLASPLVTDLRRASTFLSQAGLVVEDSLSLSPHGSGVREIELYPLVRGWALQSGQTNAPPRAVVLATSNEGTLPLIATFYSTTAAPGLRPRMRLTYIPKVGFGTP
ncbi:MAG: hypothetical protein U9Q74_02855 [Gemmatimonadota bacterium]|nr:hypothetical protein [Gemmatimonadota bacterium]